jgi:hypothetical protein
MGDSIFPQKRRNKGIATPIEQGASGLLPEQERPSLGPLTSFAHLHFTVDRREFSEIPNCKKFWF